MKRNLFYLLTAIILGYCGTAAAEKLYSPYVTPGELELEYYGGRSVDSGANDDAQKHQFAAAYGVNDWWKTELYTSFKKAPQDNVSFHNWEWENTFQLTDRGEYWLDLGASLAYEWTPQSNKADTVETRLLLAKDFTHTSHLLNVIAEKDVGSGPKDGYEGKLLWSSRYTYSEYFDPGFEIESDFGELKHMGAFKDQKHYIGPAAYGEIPLHLTDKGDGFNYRVGYLFGVSDAADNGEAVLQLEYELHL